MNHRLFFSSILSFFFFGFAVPLKTKYSRWNLPYKLAPKMKICNTVNCLFVSPLPQLSGEIVEHGGSIVCFDTLMTMCQEFTDLSIGYWNL